MNLNLLRRILRSTMADKNIDWELLRAEAKKAQKNAYANYSKFPVGAAALVDDGRIVSGCNVENASYGLTLCAECGLVSQLALTKCILWINSLCRMWISFTTCLNRWWKISCLFLCWTRTWNLASLWKMPSVITRTWRWGINN